ncbi:hypothetical protein D9M69_686980 [compost metagenome]
MQVQNTNPMVSPLLRSTPTRYATPVYALRNKAFMQLHLFQTSAIHPAHIMSASIMVLLAALPHACWAFLQAVPMVPLRLSLAR